MGTGGRFSSPPPADRSGADLSDVLLELKNQLDALRQQVSDINRRIEELHKDEK